MYIRVFVSTKVGTALPCSKVFTPKTVWPPKSSAKVSGVEEASQPAAGSIHGIASAALLRCSDFFHRNSKNDVDGTWWHSTEDELPLTNSERDRSPKGLNWDRSPKGLHNELS